MAMSSQQCMSGRLQSLLQWEGPKLCITLLKLCCGSVELVIVVIRSNIQNGIWEDAVITEHSKSDG